MDNNDNNTSIDETISIDTLMGKVILISNVDKLPDTCDMCLYFHQHDKYCGLTLFGFGDNSYKTHRGAFCPLRLVIK